MMEAEVCSPSIHTMVSPCSLDGWAKFQVKGSVSPCFLVSGDIKTPSETAFDLCLQKTVLKSSFFFGFGPFDFDQTP